MTELSFQVQKKKHSSESVLKEYFSRYLVNVRGLSQSSVRHYFDALNNISRRLKEKGLVKNDVYEISNLDQLSAAREILCADADFIEANERGRRMYSAGLNNYFRFASGEEFELIRDKVSELDVPVAPEAAVVIEQSVWKRSGILRTQAIEFAGYSCEIDSGHDRFIAENTHKPYMEGHHALPMKLQDKFSVSLDVYANIVCLCPVCHRRIHYGLKNDQIGMINRIYDTRVNRLVNSGIFLSKQEFVKKIIDL